MSKKHIVILGSGFGGIYTFIHLCKIFNPEDVKITIVSKTNHFLFTSLLHEVATGGINWLNIVEPVREIIKKYNANFIETEVELIDLKNKKVKTTSTSDVSYDYLVVSLGSRTNYYNIQGARENTLTLDTLKDANNLRNVLVDLLEESNLIKNDHARRTKLKIAVVGGGATGVELAAEIHELFHETLVKFYRNIDYEDMQIEIVDACPTVLPFANKYIQNKTLGRLKKIGISLNLNSKVKKVSKNTIHFKNRESKEYGLIVWVAGVKANTPEFKPKVLKEDKNRVKVNMYLQLEDYEDTFIIGDCALFMIKDKPLPMLAQVAYRQSRVCADNIYRSIHTEPLEEFKYRHQGVLLSLGSSYAVGNIYGINVSGRWLWYVYKAVYISKLPYLQNKIKVAVDWIVNLFYPRDISKP